MGWPTIKLGDISEVITKGTTPTSVGFEFTTSGVNFVKIESISLDGDFIPSKFAAVSNECHESLKRSQLKEGDILFSIAGALGRTALVTQKILPANTNQALAIIRIKKDVLIDKRYLILALKTGFTLEQIEKHQGGVAQQNLSLGQMKTFEIPLPPIPEQQRIVAILDQAFADIEKARANAEKNLKNARELFDSYLNQVFSQRGECWVEKPLGDVICKTLTKDPRKNPELKFLYVDVSSVSNTTLEITEATELLGKDAPSRARRVISEGNVIFATVRPTLKRIAIVPNRLDGEICSTGYFVFKTSDELNNRYLYYFLQSYCFMGEMEKLQSGASYPAVNDSQVKQTIIKYPSITEQQRIVASLDKLSDKVQQLEKGYQEKLKSLDELKKSLLQKAFSGELTKSKGIAA